MKLIEALRIANGRSEEGPPFDVLLGCGFTPLHLETAVKAHLRLRLSNRPATIKVGLYGDLAGALEKDHGHLDAVLVALEWSDLDPRLGWRTMGSIAAEVVADARSRLDRIARALDALAAKFPSAVALPSLPMAPVFRTSSGELDRTEARLRELIYGFAASVQATVVRTKAVWTDSDHDLRSELSSGFPYTFPRAEAVAKALVDGVFPSTPKKALITDLDETLWSGVLGDDGPENISWDLDHKSQFHGLYQCLLNSFAERGILLGVASKNDPGLVRKAFERSDLVVKPGHLFPVEAHWGPKAESVERTLRTWCIGPDAVVFVDDNKLELEQVKSVFPAIDCVEFRNDDPHFLSGLNERFAKRRIFEEDRLRTASLRAGQAVREASANSASLDALLAGAEARVTVSWAKQLSDRRALELVNKTNQFNLNGIRYNDSEWDAFLSGPDTQLMIVEYEDRFGKLGKIAVLGGRETDGRFEIEVWVMSCRAFSRRIEHQCLKALFERWDRVTLRYRETERNAPLRDFLTSIGSDSKRVDRSEFERHCPRLFHQRECIHA